MREIPKDVVARIKEERKQEYDEGFDAGIELARERDYATIEAVAEAIAEDSMKRLFDTLGEHAYFEASSEYREGFADALTGILQKSEESE